ncbi:MAG: tRNA pseudouridine(54/55) synthase Pus10 [Candidatus Bipolaricaulota bacterium]|nr:tRNA pseudouridine(54/55) synthase Pus10 [Candidatus Bipolaricaulota bacterium]
MCEEMLRSINNVLVTAAKIVRAGPICDECLGRAFAKVGHGLSNTERGRALRTLLSMHDVHGKSGTCWVCGEAFKRINELARRAIAMSDAIEFDTYLFGVKPSARVAQGEKLFLERFHTDNYEPLKHAFNREMGKAFEVHSGHGTVDFERPHLSYVIDLSSDTITLKVRSVYAYGRYRKLVRGIPQTRWPCRKCKGKGCAACNFTGKQYPESVEELIAAPFLVAAGADEAHLHGAGREDIDARMLGSGRPFVLEVVSPHVRSLDLSLLRNEVNSTQQRKVEVTDMHFVSRDTVALIKETHAEKTYRARVSLASPMEEERMLSAVSSLIGQIEQRTPRRVAHRRADLVRIRRLIDAQATIISPQEVELVLRGEGGLYIKELVSGDEGRTMPSLSGVLSVSALVTELDVIDVAASAFPDSV